MDRIRCGWVTDDQLYIRYHDEEWGVPVFDDPTLFEFLILETFQPGLSWITVLRKRENFRSAFAHFEVEKVAQFTDVRINELLQDSGIIRNRSKVEAAVTNAQAWLQLQQEHGSVSSYLWNFVDRNPIMNSWETLRDVPASTSLSETISKDLKKRGFKFVGPTVIYAFMQAIGMVNDHTTDCYRHADLK